MEYSDISKKKLIHIVVIAACSDSRVVIVDNGTVAAYDRDKLAIVRLSHTLRHFHYVCSHCSWLGWWSLDAITLNTIVVDNKVSPVVHRSNTRNLTSITSKRQDKRDKKANQQHQQSLKYDKSKSNNIFLTYEIKYVQVVKKK